MVVSMLVFLWFFMASGAFCWPVFLGMFMVLYFDGLKTRRVPFGGAENNPKRYHPH